ncbi:MAG: polyprenyl synthetase family protein [Clostridiales bacterium]|nr:polyprenyl synthetase family protein [Clostridiales bacterium]
MNKAYTEAQMKINEYLQSYFIHYENKYEKKFNEIINYSLMNGGKRLRPVLFYKTVEILKGDVEKNLDLACSIEMIHTYSLIHDDLPAMDDDDYRRGKLSSHKVYGEAMAILSGDALLNKAYEILFNKIFEHSDDHDLIKACRLIADFAGNHGMIGGQVVDIETEYSDISNDDLHYIIENKTAKLIIASIVSAGHVCHMSDEYIELLKKAAYHIGYSFQLIDDYLDVVGDSKIIGKSTGKDNALGKNTYVKYNGIEKTKKDAYEHLENAKNYLFLIKGYEWKFFIDLIEYLKNREK